MPRLATTKKPATRAKAFNFWDRLKEIDMFFQKRDKVHQSMHRLVKRLEKAKIPYAIMGGMAVNAHLHERTTKDVDILLTEDGLETFRSLFVPKHYRTVPKRPRRFVDRVNDVILDILVTGKYPGNGLPGPIVFPDPENVGQRIKKIMVADLVTLIQLKLAARRHQDFADVVNLIAVKKLDESFLPKLHPSVRHDFIECLEEKRREDEYIARNG
jgi:hypothetical protein